MNENAAIAFFLNDPIVNPGQKSSKGIASSGSGDAAFQEYYNRAINHSREELTPAAAWNKVNIVNTEGSAAASSEDACEVAVTPSLNECLPSHEKSIPALDSDFSLTQINDVQSVEIQQNQEQMLQRQNESAIHPDETDGSEVNLSFFTQTSAFFAQSNLTLVDLDHAKENNQAGAIMAGHGNRSAADQSKASPLFFDLTKTAIISDDTQETATSDKTKSTGQTLVSDSSITKANQHSIDQKELNQTESMRLYETSEKTPANEAHIERAPQGSDVELTNQQAPERPMRAESSQSAVQSAVQSTIGKSGEESGDKNQKTIQITRSAPDNSEVKNEMKQDSAGGGKDHSSKDPAGYGKNSTLVQDLDRFFKSNKAVDAQPFQQKMESASKNSSISMNQNGSMGESQKATPSDLSILKSREAALSEAVQLSRPTQAGQLNAQSDQAAIQSQAPSSTASSPASNGAGAAQPASMIQHYAEKIVELQEAAAKQIVRRVQGSIGADRSQITMRLNPESLGRIHVQMSMENGSLTAQISADKENTRAMLDQSLHTLRAAFEEQGLKVDRLAVNKDSFQLKQNDPGRHEDSSNESSKHRSGDDRQNGQNHRRHQDSKHTQWASWSDQMTARDYFL
ncbi:MAG: flagellar hook-length control protein FliK [Candidatus Omnitrophica bacterium]|nr:flagellar hook-length control protein FliK [Candidatus Omnitrophota bacterium]